MYIYIYIYISTKAVTGQYTAVKCVWEDFFNVFYAH